MKNEFHLREPDWNGDRTDIITGIAHFRVTNSDGTPKKGNLRLWIDYKEYDATSPEKWKLAYPYPFVMPCSQIITYPTQILNDFKRTTLHLVPLSHWKEVKTRRKRTMPQDEFKEKIQQAKLRRPLE